MLSLCPSCKMQGILAAVDWRALASYQEARQFLLVEALVLVADLALRRCCRGAPNGGSYARWREAIPLMLLLDDLLLGCRSEVVKAWIETVNPDSIGCIRDGTPGLLCTLRNLIIMIVASRGLSQLMVWSQPLRIRWVFSSG